MNWKIKLVTIFLSVSLIACEDKAAIAKAEAAKAKAAKAEAAKTEVAKAEVAKAEAAKAEAAENQRRQIVKDVLIFLQNQKFTVNLEWQTEGSLPSAYKEKHQYEFFSYDEKERSLVFRKHEYVSSDSLTDREFGYADNALENIKIDLQTAAPLVKIEDYKPSQALPAKKVSIKAKIASAHVTKNDAQQTGPALRKLGVLLTTEDEEKLKTLPFSELKEKEVVFVVSPDDAPRLKAALEDLLKAHGVVVSKY